MSELQLPHVVRPVITDDNLSEFYTNMKEFGFESRAKASLQLVTLQELQIIPSSIKKDVYGEFVNIANELTTGAECTVNTTRARLFYVRNLGYLGISLVVNPTITSERDKITSLLSAHGVEVNQPPFSIHKFQVIVAEISSDQIKTEKDELYKVVNATYPRSISLDSPIF